MKSQNGYVFFYGSKRVELYADSLYAAKVAAIAHFKAPKSKQHMVHGALAEKAGSAVIHTPTE
jgi:hypothetical protein